MPWELTYLIDNLDYKTVLSTTTALYVLDDGEMLDASTDICWCRNCDDLRMMEVLPTIDEVTEAYSNEQKYALRVFKKDSPAHAAAHEHWQRYHWRVNRVAPPKCLSCGGTNLYKLDPESSQDPVSGHSFRCLETIHCILDPPLKPLLSPEGDVIQQHG